VLLVKLLLHSKHDLAFWKDKKEIKGKKTANAVCPTLQEKWE